MLLNSIQAQGFKSFADKTVLKFGKGITAVVGPNGSGKSNISDAVRWVLGEQSTKNLRGQSMEDVIFGGTETRRPHGFCEVTLNIDNSDRTLNFDNDSVSVTRRYYRSHDSEYAINGVSVRLKDIHELFMDTGLGRDGYSMIGQGKIDTIISSKSGERRDIFEEASGISKYRYRKLEAERKLAAAEDNLLRLHDILDELESRVGPLKSQSEKAEKFLNLSERKKQLEIGLWLNTLSNSKEALKAQENKIMQCQLQYRDIENELEDFDRLTEENTAYFARLTSEIEGERLTISSANEDIVRLNGEITVLQTNIDHNIESVSRLDEEKEELGKTDREALALISDNENLIEEKKQENETLEKKLKELEEALSALLSDSEGISRQIEEKIKALNVLSSEESDLRVEKVTADTAIEEITSRSGENSDRLSLLNENVSKLSSEAKETEKMLDDITEELLSLENSLKGYGMKLQSASAKTLGIKEESDNTVLDIESKKRRVQILNDLEKNMEGLGHAVKAVVNEGKTGILKGICGPVSKLITVENQYATAVETALAASIQNIVTETENDAKRAIAFLKANNAGRATFLPINTIRSREFKETGFEDMFGFVGIASDLAKTDEKYREIIKYLLGGTIVSEDIDSAAVIAKKFGYRIKVVTLDGQVINPGGSLTGGSLIKNAGLLSRASEIKRFEEEIKELENKSQRLKENLADAVSSEEKIKADMTAVQAGITSLNEDKIRAVAELKRLEELVNNTKSEISRLETGSKEEERKLERFREISASADEKINALQEKKSLLQSEIDDMTGGRDNINEKREALSEEITDVKLRIISVGKDIESVTNSSNNLKEMIASREKRAVQMENERVLLEEKNNSLKSGIEDIKLRISQFEIKISECEKAISDKLNERNKTEKAGVELRNSEREKTTRREQISGELARLSERKDVMLKEYDDIIAKLYDEYQLTRTQAESLGIEVEKPAEAKRELADIRNKIRSLGNVNVSAIEEYKEVSSRYEYLSAQVNDVENTRAELHKLINQLTTQMKDIFTDGFGKINANFSKTFTELFGGGQASLSLSDPENVLESGIDINVKLPGKNVPSLDGLSGGEKALIALSIYFAIMRVNAPPFCFLDEVDTALDDINVDRFADYMRSSDFSTQFICVTHRRGTMEAADMLYGVTMQEKGVTRLLELNVSELEKKILTDDATA